MKTAGTNFDFLKRTDEFAMFADTAIGAERALQLGLATNICVSTCRQALEYAVKWMYTMDDLLEEPKGKMLKSGKIQQPELVAYLSNPDFLDIIRESDPESPPGSYVPMEERLKYIRLTGNSAVHGAAPLKKKEALACLKNLHAFLDWLAYVYTAQPELFPEKSVFDAKLALTRPEAPVPVPDDAGKKAAEEKAEQLQRELERLREQNEQLRKEKEKEKEKENAGRRERRRKVAPGGEETEFDTRRVYIDAMLRDAGWTEGKDWVNEYAVDGMPTGSGLGYADYALLAESGKVLAIIEAKRTCADVAEGRQQAKLYADCIEKAQGYRPAVFLSNGFETRLIDGQYPERRTAAFYARRDLEKMFNLRAMRRPLADAPVDSAIAGRYYQTNAVRSVCEAFERGNRRKALLVMATGSGKTRTVIALCKLLLARGWVKNILFLADRNSLVTQAKRSFVNLLPELSCANLCEEKGGYDARCVFSTYQTMMNCIDEVEDKHGKLYTCGHFDLVICDEAHRSIYNRYRDIFTYFDAPLVGLTATPKDDIDKNTYTVFDLEDGTPTFAYDLKEAVQDGFLVDYHTIEAELKFLREGIAYDDLTEREKEQYEANFASPETGELPDHIGSGALNDWLFNRDTIRKALALLMEKGLRVGYGAKLGKTIIFAKNHNHAEKILECFNAEYPELNGYATVIDNYTKFAQSAIDEFSEADKLPQIAISVDMLDTGIDVPEVLNLVFFKSVMSKAKFWQMVGRGTRLCPGLLDGKDKDGFRIFDLCGNFEFFRAHPNARGAKGQPTVQAALFVLKSRIALCLQGPQYGTEELKAFRQSLAEELHGKVAALNRDNFAVHQHLKYVERFSVPERWQVLSEEDVKDIARELAGLIAADGGEPSALRFDALMYGLELASLTGQSTARALKDLRRRAAAVSRYGNIPEVEAQSELLHNIVHTDYAEKAGLDVFEHIRRELRGLMKYIITANDVYNTDFEDAFLSIEENGGILSEEEDGGEIGPNRLEPYRERAEAYIREHRDIPAIAKLESNTPLTPADVRELEGILWGELGTREDYEKAVGRKPLGAFIRGIVGLSMSAAKAAFADFLDESRLDSGQIYFVNQIVNYIVANGMMPDKSVLQSDVFIMRGNIIELFGSDMETWQGIMKVIDGINENAGGAA